MNQLTQAQLKELLHYDPKTGAFLWLIDTKNQVKAGKKSGTMHHTGYINIQISAKHYAAHRLAWLYMTGEWPKDQIDHIDGNRSNNVWANLRDVSQNINMQNKKQARKDNKSTGLLGASFHKKTGKFQAVIFFDGRHKHLGLFEKPEQAHEAYLQAKRMFHEGCTL